MLSQLKRELTKLANPKKARILARFFKTGKGEYGEGDVFWGIPVPQQRKVAKRFYQEVSLLDIQTLLKSEVHEHRLTALLMLVYKYQSVSRRQMTDKMNDRKRRSPSAIDSRSIVQMYLRNTNQVNNWDLVDVTAPNILGDYLLDNDRKVLYRLAKSKSIWERRIAILATFSFIRHNQFTDTLRLAKLFLHDPSDLIQKAVGWMLREVGKRDQKVLESFLQKHCHVMPRVALRYSLERFPPRKRKIFLS